MERTPKPKATLSIVALVFASLFFVPLLPLVGLVLGLVALATRRARTPALVAVGLGATFTLLSLLAATLLVRFGREVAEGGRLAEANRDLGQIAHQLRALDEPAWRTLPDADWTPPGPVCVRPDHRVADDGSAWQVEPWHTLGFALRGPHVYRYRLRRDGDAFVIEAHADLDCHGRISNARARVSRDDEPLRIERQPR